MKLQWDKYLHELRITFTSLTGVRDFLLPLNLPSSLVDQATHLVRIVERKNHALTSIRGNLSSCQASLSTTKKELESLRLENASLTQKLADCMNADLEVVSQSFENALHQVKHFHCHLIVLREQICLEKVLKNRESISLRE